MQVRINDKLIHFPTSLSEITLGDRIRFYNEYGKELDEEVNRINAMEEGPLKDLEWSHFHIDIACKTFSFFSSIDLTVVREAESLAVILQIYNIIKACLLEEPELEEQTNFNWQGEVWEIAPPTLGPDSKIAYGEFIDSKQILQDMYELGAGKWDSLLRLCAIYLRKKGEAYDKTFALDNSARLELMKTLPMDIALRVGFFLKNSMHIYWNTLAYSKIAGPKVENTPRNTSKSGDGLTSLKASLKQKSLISRQARRTLLKTQGRHYSLMY